MADEKKFEEALMRMLSHGQMDKAKLATVSGAIVALKRQGFVIDQVHLKGTPRPDRIIINGIPDPEFFQKFKGTTDLNIRQFRLFPYGIINPEGWKGRLEFNV
jgi:hypothetical protein